ncbi:hypothetical protein SAMN04487846_2530 [Microbacterium sp. cf046]|uniref:hypothetical protein n=1 Tax=Microbacterium sp. cf046 TaxID=1761803 RepID=UPI0008E6808F|nr:hypothetical protein [Microbacterium sp. cf046]SFS09398.1 hypothetical protein SAMN04487846_2530 [Microbacterium sp. cf046]
MSEPTLAAKDEPPPPPPNTNRRWLGTSIAIASVLLVMAIVGGVLVIRGFILATAYSDSTALRPDESEEAATEPEGPAQRAAEAGTLANPYPADFGMILSDTTTNVEVFTLAARLAESENLADDVPVEPTTEGTRVVAVEFTVVGLDASVAGTDMAIEAGLWQLADQDGKGYPPLFTQLVSDPSVPLTEGVTWLGRNFYEVPAGATTPYVLLYTQYVALE